METHNQDKENILAESKETSKVKALFSDVSLKYDLMNDLMSLGLHRLWKKKLVSFVRDWDSKILDMACGTGDLAIYLKNLSKKLSSKTEIFACDINEYMLELAKDKSFDLGFSDINFSIANAENLPFEDNSFDYYIISFGIRNLESIHKALTEAFRVLKPMGLFLCLEFFKTDKFLFKNFYDFYLFKILPKMGKIVVDKEYAYSYLAHSIDKFLFEPEFKTLLHETGFYDVEYVNLFPGVASIFNASKT